MEDNPIIIKKCEICNNDATSICFQCFCYFCDSCFKFIHDKDYNLGHKKEKIDYFVPIDIKCRNHPKNIINMFCLDEKGK